MRLHLCSCFCNLLGGWNDVHGAAVALDSELNCTCFESEQGVVAAASNVLTWVELGAALANDDLAGLNLLTTETLDAEALCLRIATIGSAGCTLLRCHVVSLLLKVFGGYLLNAGNLDYGKRLAVAHALLVASLVLVLHDVNLWPRACSTISAATSTL